MDPHALEITNIVFGALVLLFGRRLFWLFVAAVGFWFGFELTQQVMQHPPEWLSLVIAIGLGVVGAVLALLLQKVAIGIAGFLVGGRVATTLFATFVVTHANYSGVTFIIGGILGALLLLVLFDWALIVFSSIAGAELIASNLHVPARVAGIILVGLTIFGIFVQAAMFARRRASLA